MNDLKDLMVAREILLLNNLVYILSEFTGETGKSESAVECLKRIINERAELGRLLGYGSFRRIQAMQIGGEK